jgi:hypothetical protein
MRDMGRGEAVSAHGLGEGLTALDFNHLATGIVTAIGAYAMREVLFATIGAGNKMIRF